jgi:ornithine cyclodeaminase
MSCGLWISEADVVSLMSLPEAIDALRDGLREEAAGRAANMVKTHATWDNGSTLHAIGAVFEGWGVVGTKTWAHTAGGPCRC